VVRAGACVKQRDRYGDRSILDGFPARLAGTAGLGPAPRRRRNPAQGATVIATAALAEASSPEMRPPTAEY